MAVFHAKQQLACGFQEASREILRNHVLILKALGRLIEFLTQADGIITLVENGRAISLTNDLVGKAVTERLDPESAGTVELSCQVQFPALYLEIRLSHDLS